MKGVGGEYKGVREVREHRYKIYPCRNARLGKFLENFESTKVSKNNFSPCEGKSQDVPDLPMSSLPFCY